MITTFEFFFRVLIINFPGGTQYSIKLIMNIFFYHNCSIDNINYYKITYYTLYIKILQNCSIDSINYYKITYYTLYIKIFLGVSI